MNNKETKHEEIMRQVQYSSALRRQIIVYKTNKAIFNFCTDFIKLNENTKL